MRFAPMASVRARLTLCVLGIIFVSTVFSAGIVLHYAHYEERLIRSEMQRAPDVDTLIQRLVRLSPIHTRVWHITHQGTTTVLVLPIPVGHGSVLVRLAIGLALGLLIGALLSRLFTRPLAGLAEGAQAFQQGDFTHRIAIEGQDEFARVAATMNEMADRVSRQIAVLEDDAQRRQQLLADVAHELRSPVASLHAMTGALCDGMADEPERRTRALAAMATATDRLSRLVADLMDLARLDLHELPLQRQTLDLRALAQASLHAHTASAQQVGLTLRPLTAGEPLLIMGDPHRLAQVLDNLLENAIAYAGQGAEVSVTLTGGNPVSLIIADTGHGIPADQLPHVFDAFFRVDQARTPADNHAGLGLRITRGLIEAHGGTLTLSSEEGRGTTVSITLPGMGERQ